MPTLLIWQGHKFRFYALDAGEPPHVHVFKDGKTLKVWLQNLEIAQNKGYNERELGRLMAIVAERPNDWMGAWNDFFGV